MCYPKDFSYEGDFYASTCIPSAMSLQLQMSKGARWYTISSSWLNGQWDFSEGGIAKRVW